VSSGATGQRRYSIMNLTVAQIEAISASLGLPSTRWDEAEPLTVMASIYAAVEGLDLAEVKKLTAAELTAKVSIEDEDEPDPTPPSG
jgi:hypothetical protein